MNKTCICDIGSTCFHALDLTGSSLTTSYGPPCTRHQSDIRATSAPNSPRTINMPPTGEMEVLHPSRTPFPLKQLDNQPSTLPPSTDTAFLTQRSTLLAPDSTRPGTRAIALSVGGIDLHSLHSETPGRSVFAYDDGPGEWCQVTTLPAYIHHHGACVLNGKLYIIGGAIYDNERPHALGVATKAMFMYDPLTNVWRRLADMHFCRAYVGVATHGGRLYAVGGEDDRNRKLDSVECYHPDLDTWSVVARMPEGGRIGAAVTVHRAQLYIIGGYGHTYKGNPVLAEILCFDLAKQCWIAKTPLIIPRCHASAVVVQDRLYLVGGRTFLEGCEPPVCSLAQVDVYDDVNDAWEHVIDMTVPRHDAGVAAVGSHVYIIGGIKTQSHFCLQSVEVLDVATNNWVTDTKPLPNPATGVASCTLVIQH